MCRTIHRYVPDCDAAIKRAEDVGATVTIPATDILWGDRYGQVLNPYGHTWSSATRLNLSPDEMQGLMKQAISKPA